MAEQIDHLADRLVAVVESGDAAALRDIYAPDLVFVLYTDPVPRSREEAITAFERLRTGLRDVRLEVTDRQPTPAGYVSQQVLHCTAADGSRHAVAHCLVTRVRHGRITRIDEYLDSAAVTALVTAHRPTPA